MLDDARVWMRLHFWACREVGLFSGGVEADVVSNKPPTQLKLDFQNYYERFIGHFMRIYERA